jgi:hypothetical protein
MNMTTSHIDLDSPVFPYFIGQEDTNPTSFITISIADPYGAEDLGLGSSELFYIAGAGITTLDGRIRTSPEHRVQLRHTFATDDDADRAYVALFTLKGLQLGASYGNSVSYTGWLTEAQFYPAGQLDSEGELLDPFIGIVEEKVADEDANGYENSGYPYTPPKVTFGKTLKFPLEVSVSLYHNQQDVPAKLVESAARYAQARVDAQKKKEAEAKAAQEKKAKRAAEHAAYLLTEEGQQDELDLKLIARIRTVTKDAEPSEEELVAAEATAVEFFQGLTELEVTWHKQLKAARSWRVGKTQLARLRFLEKFDSLIPQS